MKRPYFRKTQTTVIIMFEVTRTFTLKYNIQVEACFEQAAYEYDHSMASGPVGRFNPTNF